jgi:uncharacterized protein YggE
VRLVAAALALALTLPLSGAAATQGPVSAPALAPGEVLLQLNGTGRVTTRADFVTFSVTLSASAATEAEARRDAEAQMARILAAVRGAGVPQADIVTEQVHVTQEPSMELAADMIANAMEVDISTEPPPPPPEHRAYASVDVRVRDIARLPALTRAAEDAGGAVGPLPQYALNDPSGPRRAARVQALASARAEAEAYAAALGMRVARVVRVTERLGMDFLSMMMNDRELRRRAQEEETQGPDIATSVIVGVDYALAPR